MTRRRRRRLESRGSHGFGKVQNVGAFFVLRLLIECRGGHGLRWLSARMHGGRNGFGHDARRRRRYGPNRRLRYLSRTWRRLAGVIIGDDAANGGQNFLHRWFL